MTRRTWIITVTPVQKAQALRSAARNGTVETLRLTPGQRRAAARLGLAGPDRRGFTRIIEVTPEQKTAALRAAARSSTVKTLRLTPGQRQAAVRLRDTHRVATTAR